MKFKFDNKQFIAPIKGDPVLKLEVLLFRKTKPTVEIADVTIKTDVRVGIKTQKVLMSFTEEAFQLALDSLICLSVAEQTIEGRKWDNLYTQYVDYFLNQRGDSFIVEGLERILPDVFGSYYSRETSRATFLPAISELSITDANETAMYPLLVGSLHYPRINYLGTAAKMISVGNPLEIVGLPNK